MADPVESRRLMSAAITDPSVVGSSSEGRDAPVSDAAEAQITAKGQGPSSLPATEVPPAPIWFDERSYLTVYVNGGCIEINMSDGWSGRLSPDDVADLPAGFAAAIEEARAWADRWDVYTGTYRPAAEGGA